MSSAIEGSLPRASGCGSSLGHLREMTRETNIARCVVCLGAGCSGRATRIWRCPASPSLCGPAAAEVCTPVLRSPPRDVPRTAPRMPCRAPAHSHAFIMYAIDNTQVSAIVAVSHAPVSGTCPVSWGLIYILTSFSMYHFCAHRIVIMFIHDRPI